MGWSDDESGSGSGGWPDDTDTEPGTTTDTEPGNEEVPFTGAEKICNAYDTVELDNEDPDLEDIPDVIQSYKEEVIELERTELAENPSAYEDAEDDEYQKPCGFNAYEQILKLYYKQGKSGGDASSEDMLAVFREMMGCVTQNGSYYTKMCSIPVSNLIERGVFCDIVSPKSPWKQPREVVEQMFQALLGLTEKCKWHSHSIKVKLSLLDFYLDSKKYKEMPELFDHVESFCALTRDQGGAAENVRMNSLMTLKSIQMQFEYESPDEMQVPGLLDRWDRIEGFYNHCMGVMEGDQGIVVSDKQTEGRIHEFGGMVQMLNAQYDKAFDSFQKSFEAGPSSRRINFILLAWMHKEAEKNQQQVRQNLAAAGLADDKEGGSARSKGIDPFTDPNVKSFAEEPEIQPMKSLYHAFDGGDIATFNKVLADNLELFKQQLFLADFMDSLSTFARTEAVLKILNTYSSVKLKYLGEQVGYNVEETEQLVVALILDKLIKGSVDQASGCLNVDKLASEKVLADSKFNGCIRMAQNLIEQATAVPPITYVVQ